MSTPLRTQYLGVKRPFPDALLFFRLGDFYELYDEDAKTGARELDLMVTSRAFSRNERVPMCSVPYHSIDGPVRRLVSRGYRVAICERIRDPSIANGLAEREVVRIVSPSSALGDHHRPIPRHRGEEVMAEQRPDVAAPPSLQESDAPSSSLATAMEATPLGDEGACGPASDAGMSARAAIQLPLFGACAGLSVAAEPTSSVYANDLAGARLRLF